MAQSKVKVIAVANQKGGVGKTTITRELSACCALRGYRVLAIDCDPQGTLTSTWFSNIEPDWPLLSHVLVEPDRRGEANLLPLEDAFLNSPVQNLDIVASDIRLSRAELQPDYSTHRLAQQIKKYCAEYDLVFIDSPPQLGKLSLASLFSANYVLVPCHPDVAGLTGLADLDFTINRVKETVNPDLERLGAIINEFKPKTNLSAESRRAIQDAEQQIGKLFDTNIHDYTKIAEAPYYKQPVVEYAPNHKASDQFWALTEEFLSRVRMPLQRLAAVN